jgi:hypothetical protein
MTGFCADCRWWVVTTTPRGQCRRHPPIVPYHRTASQIGAFPVTIDSTWCGDHEAKEATL